MHHHSPWSRAGAWLRARRNRRCTAADADHTNVVPFIVLCAPRTGSTHLVDLLHQHRQIQVYNEVFHDDYATRARVHRRRVQDDQDGAAFLHDLYYRWHFHKRTAVGFKFMYTHAAAGPLSTAWDYLRDHPEIVVVHLVRENLLEAMVSHRIAERTGQWHVRHTGGGSFRGQVTLSAFDCLAYFEQVETLRARALSFLEGHPLIPVEYNDLRHREQATLDRIVDGLALPRFTPFPVHYKVETLSMRERIQNYDQLREGLAATPYARFFSD